MRNRTSDLRIPRSDALPLSHRDSTVSEVYYEVHMTRVLHTARISNFDSVMGTFFLCPSLVTRRKTYFSEATFCGLLKKKGRQWRLGDWNWAHQSIFHQFLRHFENPQIFCNVVKTKTFSLKTNAAL